MLKTQDIFRVHGLGSRPDRPSKVKHLMVPYEFGFVHVVRKGCTKRILTGKYMSVTKHVSESKATDFNLHSY